MNNDLRNITEFLIQSHGYNISVFEDSFLLKSLEKRVDITGNRSISNYLEYLKTNKDEADVLVESLNINYSEFFRNPLTFAYIEQVILPTFFEKKRKNKENDIRIWSAACASGQEAYSIAILCDEIKQNIKTNIACRIFATDINNEEISNAQMGVYPATALNKVTLYRIQTCFIQSGEYYSIIPRIKKYVDFSIFDLLENKGGSPPASIYGNFDLVFCSNLLFYYKPDYRIRILEKIGNSISIGGYLISGETEREILKDNNFREVFVNSAIFQKT